MLKQQIYSFFFISIYIYRNKKNYIFVANLIENIV